MNSRTTGPPIHSFTVGHKPISFIGFMGLKHCSNMRLRSHTVGSLLHSQISLQSPSQDVKSSEASRLARREEHEVAPLTVVIRFFVSQSGMSDNTSSYCCKSAIDKEYSCTICLHSSSMRVEGSSGSKLAAAAAEGCGSVLKALLMQEYVNIPLARNNSAGGSYSDTCINNKITPGYRKSSRIDILPKRL